MRRRLGRRLHRGRLRLERGRSGYFEWMRSRRLRECVIGNEKRRRAGKLALADLKIGHYTI
jgi:hypothetical protein